MLTVISPAKRLDFTPVEMLSATDPVFQKEALALAKTARKLSTADLQKLMSISEPLAKLNFERFKAFAATPSEDLVKPAVLAFDGDTYQGLEASTLNESDMAFAQRRLRILSGLYGLLRPMDRIQPYRLEMGSRLQTSRGSNLYEFWGQKLAQALNSEAQAEGTNLLLNCASQEYFGSVDQKALKLKIIEPVFLERKAGVEKVVSFYAKKARGAMARFVIENRAEMVDDLKDFSTGGYAFQPSASQANRLVFARDYRG
ncbi:MAG: peroxide stress protein YaaA [Rhodospirillales bacterium]